MKDIKGVLPKLSQLSGSTLARRRSEKYASRRGMWLIGFDGTNGGSDTSARQQSPLRPSRSSYLGDVIALPIVRNKSAFVTVDCEFLVVAPGASGLEYDT